MTVDANNTSSVPTAAFTNNKTTEFIRIPVEKRWVGTPGKPVTVKLLADGRVIQEVVLSAANNWKFVFTDLPKYDSADGHTIRYTVSENPVTGYIRYPEMQSTAL